MNNNFNVLILNDLCSYGKASLTVNIPILSHFGIKVSPLVSVILSNHTAFESFCAFDLTEQLEKIVEELKLRKPNFDAFYVGWIASGKQPDIVVDIIKSFNIGTILIDPILGDNGKLYPSMSNEHVNAMKELIKYADIATPNITELAILLGKDPSIKYNEEEVKDMAIELSKIGPKTVIVTSVSKDDNIGSLCYKDNNIITSYYPKIDIMIPGTGDAFGASLLAYILKGDTIENALKKSTKFIYNCVEASIKDNDNRVYGIAIEKRLNLL
ncbi:pyridoxamine kinase [Brachyspira hampsonii]|uniref:pyridoxamine kinase n=1 Tax=Brachyspira hampsonii TaxID=1287055 RepID=UPI000D3641F9|nr:pyridoxamine kinase [Brachyspira hampsonii]PTY40156.1 pyridoxamine kinase [Brachyspira hampsonii bv. II]